jgi:predicted ATPase
MSRHQVEQLVDKIAVGNALPGEVLDQVVTKTDGIPLFVEELTKMVLESGLLEPGQQQHEPGRPPPQLAIPSTLQDSLMARLDRLGTVKEVVQLGATLGREFSYDLIHAVSPLDDATLREELAKLVEAEVLDQLGIPPNAHYTFRQALIQDAAYQSLLKGARRRFHQNIAETLETRFTEAAETHPELLAHHYTAAGLQEKAIDYWEKAGRLATRRSANLEAIGHLRAGLELVQSVPDASERNRLELRLQIALGVPMTATKGFAAPEVEGVYARAGELCRDLGETPQLFPVLRGLWLFHMVRAELATAHELGRQLLRLAEGVEDSALVLEAQVSLGLTSFYRGEFVQARAHLERGIEIYRPEQHHALAFSYGDDPGVVCLTYLALVLWQLGYPDRAVDRDREARDLAERVAHPFSIALALNFSARLHQFRRESEATRERADATTRLSIEQGFTHWWTTGKILQGWALTEQGQGEDGIPLMREGLSAWQATGAEVAGPHCLALLAEACRKAGRVEEASTVLVQALAMAQKNGERLHQPELHRLKGELLAESAEEDLAGAESCFHEALVAARDQQAKSLELRAATSLGRLWQRQGTAGDARKLVAAVYGWFEEGFDTADLRDAKDLLEEIGT